MNCYQRAKEKEVFSSEEKACSFQITSESPSSDEGGNVLRTAKLLSATSPPGNAP